MQFKLKKEGGQTVDDKILDLLMADKQQRIVEMSEYCRRHDKMVTVYITGLYAAIGVGVAGKFNLDVGKDLFYVPIAMAFVFLNQCLLIHAVSQSFWAMSLAKYIHFAIDMRLRNLLFSKNGTADKTNGGEKYEEPFSCTWDDWNWEMKGCANSTRAVATILWVVLVHAVSITALALVDFNSFAATSAGRVTTFFFSTLLICILVYIWSSFAKLSAFAGHFKTHPDKLKVCHSISVRAFCVGAAISILIVCVTWYVVVKQGGFKGALQQNNAPAIQRAEVSGAK